MSSPSALVNATLRKALEALGRLSFLAGESLDLMGSNYFVQLAACKNRHGGVDYSGIVHDGAPCGLKAKGIPVTVYNSSNEPLVETYTRFNGLFGFTAPQLRVPLEIEFSNDVFSGISNRAGLDSDLCKPIWLKLRRFKEYVVVLSQTMIKEQRQLSEQDVKRILRESLTILLNRSGGITLSIAQAVEEAILDLYPGSTPLGSGLGEAIREGKAKIFSLGLSQLPDEDRRSLLVDAFCCDRLEEYMESSDFGDSQSMYIRNAARMTRSLSREFQSPLGV